MSSRRSATPPPSPPARQFVIGPYNLPIPVGLADWQIELYAFKLGWEEWRGGLGKYGHCRRAFDLLYPELEWNDWLERLVQGFCDTRYAIVAGDTIVRVVSLVGVASASKTFAMGRFAFLWWLCDTAASIAILTSTTKGAVGQRVWPVIQRAYHSARHNLAARYGVSEDQVELGNLVDSQKVLQAVKGSNDRAIFAQAVKGGETSKAEAFIQGQHAPRILVAIDEANETPEAIFGVISNLKKGCADLTIIVSGNPMSRLDPHGRCCTPRGGWSQRPPQAIEWPTEGVPEWQIDPGLCIQLRGSDSPNVRAGRTLYPYLYSWENYQASLQPGVRNTLRYWRYDAGDWAPDGLCNTVFNDLMAMGCGLSDPVLFLSTPVAVSFMDPAFGGDACVQVVGRLGEVAVPRATPHQSPGLPTTTPTRTVLLVTHTLELALDPDARDRATGKPIDYIHQIAAQFIANCAAHGVSPVNAGLYSTGTGMGIASVLATDWSGEVLKVEEGGRPSDLPVSQSDRRPASEVYDRRVTELWFSARSFAEGGQLKGVPAATLIELCAREYTTTGKPWRYAIETKDELKAKLGHSCDRADATVGLCELVRVRHGLRGGPPVAPGTGTSWDRQVAEVTESWEASYSAENEQEEVASAGHPGEAVW